MRVFEEFPENGLCPICSTNKNEQCLLMIIDGTEEGNVAEATTIHLSCLQGLQFRFNDKQRLIYSFIP